MFDDSIASVLKKMNIPYTKHEESSFVKMYLMDVNAENLPLHGGITDNNEENGKHVSISFFFEVKNSDDLLVILTKVNELNDNGNVGTFIYDRDENSLVYQLVIPKLYKKGLQRSVFEFYMENIMILFRDNKEQLMQL